MNQHYIKKYKNFIISIDNDKNLSFFNHLTSLDNPIKKINFNFKSDDTFRNFEIIASKNQYVIGKTSGIVEFYDFDTDHLVDKIILPLSDEYFCGWNLDILALSPNEDFLVVGQVWYKIYPLNLFTKEAKEISISAQPLKIIFSPCGNYIGILHGEQGGLGVEVYSINQGELTLLYEKWSVIGIGFNSNYLILFNQKNDKCYLQALNIQNNFKAIWETEFELQYFDNNNPNDYDFIQNKITATSNEIILNIFNHIIFVNQNNGAVNKKVTYDYKINDFIINEDNIILATEEGIREIKK